VLPVAVTVPVWLLIHRTPSTYGPLLAGLLRLVMCDGASGVDAFGNVSVVDSALALGRPALCLYYVKGRIPIESSAIVVMQTRAESS